MSKKKVLIHSIDGSDTRDIRDQLEANLYVETYLAKNPEASRSIVRDKKISIIVVNVDTIGVDDVKVIRDLRTLGGETPTLVLAQKVEAEAEKHFFSMKQVNFLSRPYENKDLIGLVHKLMSMRGLPQQQFQRYRTDQFTYIEPLSGEDALNSTMYNLSEGGAYLEFEEDSGLRVGDIFKLRVKLSETESSYNLNAKVVWRTRKGRFSGKYGAGCQFIKPEEVYLRLLERV